MPCFDATKVAILNNFTKLCAKNNENGETKPCFSIKSTLDKNSEFTVSQDGI